MYRESPNVASDALLGRLESREQPHLRFSRPIEREKAVCRGRSSVRRSMKGGGTR